MRPLAVKIVNSATPLRVAAVALLVCYVAAEIVVPVVLAVLLAFLLQPIVAFLDRRRVPHAVSCILALALAFGLIVGIFGYAYFQLSGASAQFGRWFVRLQDAYQYFLTLISWQELTGEPLQPAFYLRPEVWTSMTVNVLSQLTVFFATIVLIMFIVFFLLRDGHVLMARMLAASGERLAITREILSKTNDRIHRYIVTIFLIEFTVAMMLTLVMWLLGVPYAFLWGVLAGILGLIPFIGATIAAIPPVLVTLAEYDGVGRALAVLGIYVALQMFDSKFITPHLVGRRINISPLVILLSTLFWGWIWGPLGLLLATPMIVCIKVAAENIPSLHPLAILMSGEPAPADALTEEPPEAAAEIIPLSDAAAQARPSRRMPPPDGGLPGQPARA